MKSECDYMRLNFTPAPENTKYSSHQRYSRAYLLLLEAEDNAALLGYDPIDRVHGAWNLLNCFCQREGIPCTTPEDWAAVDRYHYGTSFDSNRARKLCAPGFAVSSFDGLSTHMAHRGVGRRDDTREKCQVNLENYISGAKSSAVQGISDAVVYEQFAKVVYFNDSCLNLALDFVRSAQTGLRLHKAVQMLTDSTKEHADHISWLHDVEEKFRTYFGYFPRCESKPTTLKIFFIQNSILIKNLNK